MEENKSYFGEIGHGLKTLATGMKVTWKEYFKDFFTNKSTKRLLVDQLDGEDVNHRHTTRIDTDLRGSEEGIIKQEINACNAEEHEQQERGSSHDLLGHDAHDG